MANGIAEYMCTQDDVNDFVEMFLDPSLDYKNS